MKIRGRVEELNELLPTLQPEPFGRGDRVRFRRRQLDGVVCPMRRGFIMTESATDDLAFFGGTYTRDPYGIYMVKITASTGAEYTVFAHESELELGVVA